MRIDYKGTILAIIETLRPKQWIKNFLVFAGIIFSKNLFNVSMLLDVILTFFIFCLSSGIIYTINDMVDVEKDKSNPLKATRPIASGRLKIKDAKIVVAILLPICLAISYSMDVRFFLVVVLYIALQIFYSFYLKNIPILDIFSISLGSLLRVVGGVVVIGVDISSWLFICTILLALLLTISKRRYELIALDQEAKNHRMVLAEYSPHLLDQMLSIVTTSLLVTYIMYTISEETITRFGTKSLVFTTPFVLYGIFRYLYLMYQKDFGGSPESAIIFDRPLMINVALWIIIILILIYL
ncbi:MAG: decaprenyl-phosphate phosphoribosyltransferase [bacterium]